jgi:hypothetical protein
MADNRPSHDSLSPTSEAARVKERRDFLRRATLLGLPVALATVRPSTLWAQGITPSCAQSMGPSGCKARFMTDHPFGS